MAEQTDVEALNRKQKQLAKLVADLASAVNILAREQQSQTASTGRGARVSTVAEKVRTAANLLSSDL